MPISKYYPETPTEKNGERGEFSVQQPVMYWPAWAVAILVEETVVIVDKDWAERAALALPAHMNLTGLMIEIDLAKNRKGNESQKSNSIKNELKKKKN